MKILYIHQYFSTPKGAVGTRSYEFGKRLVASGHEVTMLCGNYHLTDVPAEVEGMRVIQIPVASSNRDPFAKRVFSFLNFSLRATWYALRLKYDLVYATSTPLTVGVPALAAKWLRRKRFIFEVRDLWPELPRAMGIIRNGVALGFLEWFETRCYRSADACVGLAPGIVEGIQRKAPGKRVELIPNGCDLEMFGGSKAESEKWKAESGNGETSLETNIEEFTNEGSSAFQFPTSSLSALFCGAHGRANGLDAVLDAAAELMRRGRKDIQFTFVGDGQLKPQLVQRAEREGLENCIFLDAMPKHDLAKLMQTCDLGLMILENIEAFQYGTSPNKFFDYIAAGLPVLCNYPGWVSEMIVEHQCGVSVPAADAVAFADAMAALADGRESLPEMGQRSRGLAEREFDRDALFQRLHALIADVGGHAG